jgi:hypothetical protein
MCRVWQIEIWIMKLLAYKGTVIVDPDSIVVAELKRLLNEIKTVVQDEKVYDQICIFIFLLCDLSNDNPLVDRPYNTRREEALDVAFGSTLESFKARLASSDILRDLINKCIDVYIKDVNTDEQKDVATYSKKMDQFRVMLHGMQPTIERNTNERTGMISYSTNMDIINSVLSDIVSLIQAKASMIALHTTGIIPKHLRGGLSPLAKGKVETVEELIESNTEEDANNETES